MPAGGEMLIKVAPSRGHAVLEVIDTGTGIAPEDLPRIFQVYYSTKTRGTGLGLPTTRRIIREHGGDIRVESEPGKGTRFIINLPLVKWDEWNDRRGA
jgi:two-component system sensor histidine kinase BaeS